MEVSYACFCCAMGEEKKKRKKYFILPDLNSLKINK